MKWSLVLCVALAGCAAAPRSSVQPTGEAARPGMPAPALEDAIAAFVDHEAKSDWSPRVCSEVAAMFERVADARSDLFAKATFDAGLSFQRCRDHARAEERFRRAAERDPAFHPAAAKTALYRNAVGDLERAVVASEFRDVAALVDLATLQVDDAKAKQNLQRALAIDDTYMPALNQLALQYRRSKRLELALLVCSQATKKNERYAPIHNTAGLVLHELGQPSAGAAEFARAIELDSSFFEAHMNLAALNASFRGFDRAEQAYRRAVELRPNDYDAHLGLALALRGQGRIDAAQSELDAAKRIGPDRPEAYFNEGVLHQDFGGSLERAERSFEMFLDKAKGKAQYAVAVAQARERIQDVEGMGRFMTSP